MTDRDRSRVHVRTVLGEDERSRRLRGVLLAAATSAALVAAVIAVGLAVGWPVWVVALAALLPLGVGLFASRTAYVLRRDQTGPAAR